MQRIHTIGLGGTFHHTLAGAAHKEQRRVSSDKSYCLDGGVWKVVGWPGARDPTKGRRVARQEAVQKKTVCFERELALSLDASVLLPTKQGA